MTCLYIANITKMASNADDVVL